MEHNNLNFFPRCLNNTRFISYNSTGYITPCCWVDNSEEFKDFYDESLHIDNNENIEDIFNSNVWQKFYHKLEVQPETAPNICRKQCKDIKTNPNRDRIRLNLDEK